MGLVENGFKQGDKIVIWIDQNSSAEVLAAQLGAAKAGVTTIVITEKESTDALNETLKNSAANGLIISP